MKSAMVVGFALAGLVMAGPACASADLAKSSGCMKCHDVEKKKMGPSFKDIAAAQKGKAGAEDAMVAKLAAGKDHAPVKAGEADLKTLAKWILAL
ncbi:MAG: cytochrome C' [Betaproteobacteria bacterium]|nr:cytochrome C' [Betaproteobacteria bacterium]